MHRASIPYTTLYLQNPACHGYITGGIRTSHKAARLPWWYWPVKLLNRLFAWWEQGYNRSQWK